MSSSIASSAFWAFYLLTIAALVVVATTTSGDLGAAATSLLAAFAVWRAVRDVYWRRSLRDVRTLARAMEVGNLNAPAVRRRLDSTGEGGDAPPVTPRRSVAPEGGTYSGAAGRSLPRGRMCRTCKCFEGCRCPDAAPVDDELAAAVEADTRDIAAAVEWRCPNGHDVRRDRLMSITRERVLCWCRKCAAAAVFTRTDPPSAHLPPQPPPLPGAADGCGGGR